MRKGEIINGYEILDDFVVAGGMSKISFAQRDGETFFIKEFLSPKYPTPDSPGSERIKAQKRKACEDFERHHRELNNLIATKVSKGGNLVYAVDFFREGASYYKINEKIDTTSLTLKKISSLPLDKINVIARSVCHSLGILHSLNIIHGDLKPENILIKETPVGYTGKLIDFDDSYYSEHPPRDKENLVGTPEYYSPELAAYIQDEDDEIPGDTLTLASDVFTLGVILTEYFTGEKPRVDKNIPIWAAVKEGRELRFCKKVPSELDALLRSMMAKDPKDRPAVKKVQTMLKDIQDGKRLKPDSSPDSGGLRGPILTNPPISPPETKTVSETRVKLRGGILKK